MSEPINPTVPVTHTDVMQRAVDLLYAGNDPTTGKPSLEYARTAQALVALARELRLGAYGKASPSRGTAYASVTRPVDFSEDVLGIRWRKAEGAVRYTIEVPVDPNLSPRVKPHFPEQVSETDETADSLV